MSHAELLGAALVATTTVVTVLIVGRSVSLSRELRTLCSSLRRTANYHLEGARFIEGRRLLAQMQATTEGAVEGGTAIVRTVHHGIAGIPFSILEAIPVTRDTTRVVRAVHDLTADSVYAAISAVNRAFGGRLRKGLALKPQGNIKKSESE